MSDFTVTDIIRALGERVTELERRGANRRRTGIVAEGPNDDGLYRVELSRQGGKPYLTPWIKARTLGAGTVKVDVVHAVGEQVDVVSESGDLADARIDFGTYSNANPRDNSDNVPLRLKIGNSVLEASADGFRLTASKIVLDGEVHLGGEGGQLLHRKGDADSDGDTAVGSASRVYAV